jgi:hypothetical protein
MKSGFLAGSLGILALTGLLLAQDKPQQGTIKKVDAGKGSITLTVAGKDMDFKVTDGTRLKDTQDRDITDRLKDRRLKQGAAVVFLAQRDGTRTLVGLKLAGKNAPPAALPGKRIVADTSRLVPLTEMGTRLYQGQQGGLYPDGKNERPAAHEAAGRRLAKEVQPLDADGKPSPGGKIVLLSVGMSNTAQISTGFAQALRAGRDDVNPCVVFVNGAQGGMTAAAIESLEGGSGKRYWSVVDARLAEAGLTRQQVQVVWIKQADAGPSEGFPGYARKLQKELGNIVRLLHGRFANLKLVYLSSRTYGGYATTRLNPEPYAYESGFSVKWLIEEQIKGDAALNYDPKKGAVKAPWLSWGPYLWANGEMKRTDGFRYAPGDFGPDGTHHAAAGIRKTGALLLACFKSDATTKPWFRRAVGKE